MWNGQEENFQQQATDWILRSKFDAIKPTLGADDVLPSPDVVGRQGGAILEFFARYQRERSLCPSSNF